MRATSWAARLGLQVQERGQGEGEGLQACVAACEVTGCDLAAVLDMHCKNRLVLEWSINSTSKQGEKRCMPLCYTSYLQHSCDPSEVAVADMQSGYTMYIATSSTRTRQTGQRHARKM